MKNRRIGKAALLTAALALTASLSVGSALAYFTAYCTAQGSQKMSMGFTTTEVDEDVIDDAKHISITNTGDYDCFVRVRVFAPDDIQLEYDEEGGESNWVKNGDYWKYVKVLTPGDTTTTLIAKYVRPENPDEMDGDINIVVVYEYSPVFYNEETGEPEPDWDFVVTETAGDDAGTGADDTTEQEGNE